MSYEEYDKRTLDNLHRVELEIMDEFVRICDNHKLKYFMTGGTMLGAVRHNGFIPWDDDIDVGMPRKDYDLFIKYAKEELNSKYFLDCFETNKECYLPFAKIKKNGTIFDEQISHHINNHKGIFIDIIPFENAKKSDSIIQKVQAILVKSITDTMYFKNKIGKLSGARHQILVVFLSIFPKKFLMNMQKSLMKLNKDNDSEYMVALAGTYGYQKETMKRDIFIPTKEIQFENTMYFGMNKPDKYLSRLFGNYMELPPKNKRINHVPLKIDFGKNKNSKKGC